MKHDVLELTALAGGNVQTVHITRGSLEVGPGHLSYVQLDDAAHDPPARTYIPLARLERFRHYNLQNA